MTLLSYSIGAFFEAPGLAELRGHFLTRAARSFPVEFTRLDYSSRPERAMGLAARTGCHPPDRWRECDEDLIVTAETSGGEHSPAPCCPIVPDSARQYRWERRSDVLWTLDSSDFREFGKRPEVDRGLATPMHSRHRWREDPSR